MPGQHDRLKGEEEEVGRQSDDSDEEEPGIHLIDGELLTCSVDHGSESVVGAHELRSHKGDEACREPEPQSVEEAGHLYEEVSAPLSQIADLTNERTRFEPAISKRSFSLALTDIGEAALLPRILRAVTRAAPDVRIESHRIDIDTVAEDVVTGRVDAAIASSLVPATVNQEVLFHDRYGCIVPGDLGDDDGVARIEDLRQLREVRVDHSVGHNAIADAITNLGPTVFSPVPHVQVQGFASLPRIVANGRYAGIVPIGALRELTKLDDTRILDLPCESPERAVRLLSHRIHATSGYSAHRWFLDTIRGALRDLYRDELGLA